MNKELYVTIPTTHLEGLPHPPTKGTSKSKMNPWKITTVKAITFPRKRIIMRINTSTVETTTTTTQKWPKDEGNIFRQNARGLDFIDHDYYYLFQTSNILTAIPWPNDKIQANERLLITNWSTFASPWEQMIILYPRYSHVESKIKCQFSKFLKNPPFIKPLHDFFSS